MESPAFSKFRSLMDVWDTFLLEQDNANTIRNIIDNNGLIMFFRKDKEYFGTGEDGRIVFAKMKNPNEGMPEGWEKEASFTGYNLSKMLRGEPAQHVFDHKDIKKMKIVDQEKMIKKISSETADSGKKIKDIKVTIDTKDQKHDRDEAPNFTRTDEE